MFKRCHRGTWRHPSIETTMFPSQTFFSTSFLFAQHDRFKRLSVLVLLDTRGNQKKNKGNKKTKNANEERESSGSECHLYKFEILENLQRTVSTDIPTGERQGLHVSNPPPLSLSPGGQRGIYLSLAQHAGEIVAKVPRPMAKQKLRPIP